MRGKLIGIEAVPCSVIYGCQQDYFYIYEPFVLNSSSSFSIQFSANEILGVVLTYTTNNQEIFNLNASSLQSTTYQLSPGAYTITMTNYNAQTVTFTITDYVK